MDELKNVGGQLTGIITAVIGVAIVAVIVSNGSDTVQVIQSFFQGMKALLSVIVSPVQGGSPVNVTGGNGTSNPLFATSNVYGASPYVVSNGATSLGSTSLGISTPGFSIATNNLGGLISSGTSLYNTIAGTSSNPFSGIGSTDIGTSPF